MSKRETEKLIKEVWKEKLADNLANKGAVQSELGDFLFNFLQKKVGIQTAVIEVRTCKAVDDHAFIEKEVSRAQPAAAPQPPGAGAVYEQGLCSSQTGMLHVALASGATLV